MVIIQNYMHAQDFYITTLNHDEIGEFFDEKISAVYANECSEKTHWIAEPSKLAEIKEYCLKHGHSFNRALSFQ